MGDFCECVCEYIWAMRRILAAMHTQSQCSDTECFTEHPGYEPGGGEESSGGLTQAVIVVLLWVIIAVVLFLFRPRSLRGSGNEKPHLRENGEDDQPPPEGRVQ